MGDFLKKLTDNWFNNSRNNAAIRHEFPLYNVTDGWHTVEQSTSPLVMDQNREDHEKNHSKEDHHLK
ncbi:hypothetical protein [Alkaliphilus transvaalensis]|uniref:hypothetical protein n=1 Tax=Alkaliphilus transvaalensis TaxID=114628 RepID=UPI00047B41DC|nr:hypothetical protein [Alkaliphilus transvaalensis]